MTCSGVPLFLNCRKKKYLMMVHAKREPVVLCDMTCKCCIGRKFPFVYVEGGAGGRPL